MRDPRRDPREARSVKPNGSVFAHLTPPELEQLAEAERFITFCDGFEDAGSAVYAGHGRKIARDAIRTLAALDAERSARRAIQKQRDDSVAILAARAGEAASQ